MSEEKDKLQPALVTTGGKCLRCKGEKYVGSLHWAFPTICQLCHGTGQKAQPKMDATLLGRVIERDCADIGERIPSQKAQPESEVKPCAQKKQPDLVIATSALEQQPKKSSQNTEVSQIGTKPTSASNAAPKVQPSGAANLQFEEVRCCPSCGVRIDGAANLEPLPESVETLPMDDPRWGDVVKGINNYDHSIHNNPDACAWARFFMETKARVPTIADDEGCMIGWFANAMMAMHDFMEGKRKKESANLSSEDAEKAKGWIAVDLDGTLAHYNGWINEEHIGEPVPLMADRVRAWLVEGKDVRIFTARADGGLVAIQMGNPEGEKFKDLSRITRIIQDWTEKHFGVRLPVTNRKDYGMVELWDDRCMQVIPNTGVALKDKRQIRQRVIEMEALLASQSEENAKLRQDAANYRQHWQDEVARHFAAQESLTKLRQELEAMISDRNNWREKAMTEQANVMQLETDLLQCDPERTGEKITELRQELAEAERVRDRNWKNLIEARRQVDSAKSQLTEAQQQRDAAVADKDRVEKVTSELIVAITLWIPQQGNVHLINRLNSAINLARAQAKEGK